jgi:uncharacterized Fe-S cluster-containing radical SAM superfamily enzyme
MTVLAYEDLEFIDKGDDVLVLFMRICRFSIKKADLLAIGDVVVRKHELEFDCSEKSANTKFSLLLQKGFSQMVGVNNRRTVYVHRNSGVPLIGSNVFGLVDRDTNVIEIKPMTGCNLNCTFCSVDEGTKSRKVTDVIIEEEYLIQEFERLSKMKKGVLEAHIAGHSEPTLYPKLLQLVQDLKKIEKVKDIAIDTNGVLLTEEDAHRLIDAGMTRFDLSLHALDPDLASKLAGGAYPLGHVLSLARFLSKRDVLLLAPVFLPGVNDLEIEKIIVLSKELRCPIGIQNFLEYGEGRSPAKGISMDAFFGKLDLWEKKYAVDLRLKDLFHFVDDKVLEKPFVKGDRLRAHISFPGKYAGEFVCVANERVITVFFPKGKAVKEGTTVSVKIIRDKHNVFKGVPA